MTHRQIRAHCELDEAGTNLLRATMTELGLSARAHDKVLRLARTIADLDTSDPIRPPHVSEAINYRMLDRNLWS
jgi:magnesium chelatase family protein